MSGVRVRRLSHGIPSVLAEELVTPLASGPGTRVERIVSRGHASPDGHWYDQQENEFVLVTQGQARLEVEGQGELELGPGDFVVLPAHVRHRLSWTTPHEDTVWLAVFFS